MTLPNVCYYTKIIPVVNTANLTYLSRPATTKGGSLRLTIEKVNPEFNHDLNYRSAMIQSWSVSISLLFGRFLDTIPFVQEQVLLHRRNA